MDQPVTPQDKLYIVGEWRRGHGAEIESRFPADGSLNVMLAGASVEDVDADGIAQHADRIRGRDYK